MTGPPSASLGDLTADRAAARHLRDALRTSGYDDDHLAQALQVSSLAGDARGAVDWREVAGSDEPLTDLVELFVFGRSVDVARAAAALAPLSIEDAVRAGLLESDSRSVVSPWEVAVHDGLLLLGDHPGRMRPGNVDFVGTISNSTRTLSHQTLRRPVEDALDLGTGSGILALLAARHSTRVLGIDVNARAAQVATFNAGLNEVDNTDFAVGDWFGAVGEERRFGLVVANLPFIAAPQVVFRFAHGGLDPNELSRRIVRGAAARIADGGIAQILTSWTRGSGDDRIAPVRRFVDGTGCDAVVVTHGSREAASYAAEQCGWLAPGNRARYEELFREWVRYYREVGADAVEYGLISLRPQAAGKPWLHSIDAPGTPGDDCGDHVRRLFAGIETARALRHDEELLGGRFDLVEGHRVTQASSRKPDGYHPEPTTVDLTPDVGYKATVSVYATAVLFSMQPAETLGATVERVAAETGIVESVLAAEAVAAVKELLQLGMVETRTL
ncbi:MAG TPA: methyltransferase [Solirubrobacteraceae bacterium]|nr:methyltransferase [Solirubrobacteraceae bacterium]